MTRSLPAAVACATEVSAGRGGQRFYPAPSTEPPASRLDAVERFYAELGLPARYQLSAAAQPPEFEAILTARGYAYDAPVRVSIPDAADAVERTPPGNTTITSEIADEWLDGYAAAHGEDDVARRRLTVYGRLLQDVRPSVAAVVTRLDGAVVGIGLGLRERCNMPVVALYEGAGFSYLCDYWYRVQP